MKYLFLVAILQNILLFISTCITAQTSPYIFENIGITDGLSQSCANSIIQDKKGFLWIATQDGLNRFDGHEFKVFRPDFQDPVNTIIDGFVLNLAIDKLGNIVLGTFNSGVDIYDPVQEKFHHINNQLLAGKTIRSIFIDAQNNYFTIHEKGISKISFPIKNNFDSVVIENYNVFLGKNLSEIFQYRINVVLDKDDNWIFQINNNLYFFGYQDTDFGKYNIDKLPPHSFQVINNSSENFQIGMDLNNNIWILYADRIEKIINFKNKSKEVIHFKKPIDNTNLNGFYVGIDSCIYFRNFNRQFCSYNIKTSDLIFIKKEVNNNKSIGSDIINSFIEDSKGNLWVATNSGLSKYNAARNKFRHIDVQPQNKLWLQDYWPFSFEEDRYGNIWVGTLNGKGLYIYNKKTNTFKNLQPLNLKNKRAMNQDVMSIFKDKEGQMWIGTNSYGLGKFNEQSNNFNLYSNNPEDSTSISANTIYEISEDKFDNLWVATYQGINKLNKKTGKFTHYLINPLNLGAGETNNRIQSLIINDDGSIWLGTFGNGLQKLSFDSKGNPHFKKYVSDIKDSTSLSFNNIFSLLKDKDGNIWVSTFGGGLNKFNPKTEKFERFTVRNGLPNNVVYGALQDKFGRIWASTNYGLSMIDQKNGKINNYTVNQGLQSNEFNQNAFFQDSEGLLYFGGTNGYNVFNPSLIKLDTTMSNVLFTDFKLSNKSVIPGEKSPLKVSVTYADEIKLKYWQNDFSFEFTSDNYNSPSDIQYAYMIENYHSDWNNIGHKRTISFTGFQPGEYILKVKATNADGVWSETYTSIKIIIAPPFWKTPWFYILMIIFIIGIILTYIRSRTKKLLEDKKLLEQKVKERTTEIESQKDEILVKNKELNLLNEEIKAQRDNLKDLNTKLTDKNHEVEKQKDEILDKNEELNQLNHEISTQRDNLKEMNDELSAMNDEILKQRNEIEQKNLKITDSIQYAQRIQSAVLPSQNILDNAFAQNFVLFRPRDIVSGDFYFINRNNQYIFLAAADCTGHGVPGAFMSMLGIALLNEIVRKPEIKSAAQVLNELRSQIKNSLQQTGQPGEQQDGMDIAFCAINLENLQMEYAGANIPLWIIKNGNLEKKNESEISNSSLIVYDSDRQPIGIYPKEKSFTNHQIKLEKGDSFYIFSDGYHSQFGGKKRDKLSIKRLQETILLNADKSLSEQKEMLEQNFDNWRGENEQVDDLLVIGVKV